MTRISRDARLALGLVAMLLVVTFAAGLQQSADRPAPPYASYSNAPDGTLALLRWLKQIGFDVNSDVGLVYEPPANAALIVVFEPSVAFTTPEWDKLDSWVTNGGTLLLAGEDLNTALAMRHYDFSLAHLDDPQPALSIQVPLMISPPLRDSAAVHAEAYLSTERSDYVTHLAVEQGPVLVSFPEGKGRVFLSTAPFPFSNAGLKATNNPQLVLNIVTATTRAGGIWFDEWHHGVRGNSANMSDVGPENWLATTLGGRALLYVAAVVFVALLLQGRSFGKPVPPVRDRARRAPLEYITAIANLNRRAGHRRALLDDYHHRLKRDLGRRYRLSPSLDDPEFVRQIAIYRPDLNTQDLQALMARLRQRVANENEMVELTARVAAWLDEKPGSAK